MIRRGGLDGLPWVRMGGGLVPREERDEQERRATIKAHPATPHHTRPYGNGISPGRMESRLFRLFTTGVRGTVSIQREHDWRRG
jgi:hypothetical protein